MRCIVPTVLYGTESWEVRAAERRRLTLLEMKCSIGMTTVWRNKGWNQERRRANQNEVGNRACRQS